MPTPFMHLHMAEEIRPQLSTVAQNSLEEHWPAFYLGNIAPDFQAISDVHRNDTHFYPIPPAAGDFGAFDRMQAAFSDTRPDFDRDPNQAWFLLGYGVHLDFDLWWDHSILTPFFRHGEWADAHARYTAHNTLLTWLDHQSRPFLSVQSQIDLMKADAHARLPFDPENDLTPWQARVAEQLHPDAPSLTIDIYANRMGLSSETFQAQLESEAWMDKNVFQIVDRSLVLDVIKRSRDRAIRMIDYRFSSVPPNSTGKSPAATSSLRS